MKEDTHEALQALVKRLRSFLDMEQAGNVDLVQWGARVQEFRAFLNTHPILHGYIDENIWHYLIDIDIRIKENEQAYAQLQTENYAATISALKAKLSP